ncbi:hypothetical protein J8273_8843 [Carpediemonas membranifera]|uniref:Uncharacterized protein n=1 Tax=Carpediemonas membranifera TaxID=201153 RepID=A0A8J6ARG1_9EUKA|nr:hypothetical protein J8273_8843 [Carpediemonas membranifera]|eukprot:KAG9389550.1 hypothetical protein J8273_8843 [Carpediemonas membranifera]
MPEAKVIEASKRLYREGFGIVEIAAILNVPVSAFRAQMLSDGDKRSKKCSNKRVRTRSLSLIVHEGSQAFIDENSVEISSITPAYELTETLYDSLGSISDGEGFSPLSQSSYSYSCGDNTTVSIEYSPKTTSLALVTANDYQDSLTTATFTDDEQPDSASDLVTECPSEVAYLSEGDEELGSHQIIEPVGSVKSVGSGEDHGRISCDLFRAIRRGIRVVVAVVSVLTI